MHTNDGLTPWGRPSASSSWKHVLPGLPRSWGPAEFWDWIPLVALILETERPEEYRPHLSQGIDFDATL